MTSRLLDALDGAGGPYISPIASQRANSVLAARATQTRAMPSTPDRSTDMFLATGRTPEGDTGGFHLNYDESTPVRAIDIGGPDQQKKLAEFVTSAFDNVNHFSVKDSMTKLGLESHEDYLPGLEVRLMPHQCIGVNWMLEQERGQYKGGILADDMGLGKTVQMIATMVMNMPKSNSERQTTLIVVPAALLQQWKDEIESKTNGILRVHIHHGKDKLKKVAEVNEYDAVITTYQTLNGDFSMPKDLEAGEEEDWLVKNGGVLARTKFHRAIADEAQFIRNRSTKASTTLAHVRATYRWMLTGTPVTNTLADIYGLLRFGRFRPWNDWNDFNDHVAKVQAEDAPLAGSRTQAILRPLLLRRTKDSQLEGEPILKLPPKEIELVTIEFSADERDIYDSFEKQTKIRVNKFIRERSLVKNHAAVLVMILRLRQLCCHPNLILSQTEEMEDPTMLLGDDNQKELTRAQKAKGSTWVDNMKAVFLKRALATETLDYSDEGDAPEASCPVCQDLFVGNTGRVLHCGHEVCFDCVLELRSSPVNHDGVFGEGSERENAAAEKKFEEAQQKGFRPCPTCKTMVELTDAKVFKSTAFKPSDEELSRNLKSRREKKRSRAVFKDDSSDSESNSDVDMVSAKVAPKDFDDLLADSDDDLPDAFAILGKTKEETPPKKKARRDDGEEGMDFSDDSDDQHRLSTIKKRQPRRAGGGSNGMISAALRSVWGRGDDDLEPSTKMLQLIEYIKEWEVSGDKIICYSQWTSMLDLVERLFSRYGLRCLKFDGRMNRESRDITLATFKKRGGPRIILISTRCGGVGLNLVSANRIVNLDLSWNYAAESQAYDRAHRIGQEKPVYVKRLVISNTIEERMLKLQDVKVGLAEAALGEGNGQKLHKLSVKDIKYLFGMTAKPTNAGATPDAQGQRSGLQRIHRDEEGSSD